MAAIASNGTGGGVWSATASWAGGAVPAEGDTVQIVSGDTITLDTTVVVGADSATPAIDVLAGGTLNWDNLGSDILTLKGNLNISGTVTFDGRAILANILTIKMNYSDSLANNKYWVSVNAGGTLSCYGFDKTRSYDALGADCDASQAVVVTANDNSANWLATDDVVITQSYNYSINTNEHEVISSFSGKEITLVSNLSYAHLSFYTYVANLSRNIVWTSYNTDYTANIKITNATINFSWTRFTHIGKAAYSLAFSGNVSTVAMDYCSFDYNGQYTFVVGSGQVATGSSWTNNVFFATGGWLFHINNFEFAYNISIQSSLSGGGGTINNVHHNIWCRTTSQVYYAWGVLVNTHFHYNRIIGCNQAFNLSSIIKGEWHNNEVYGTNTNSYPITIQSSSDHLVYDNIIGSTDYPCSKAFMIIGYNSGVYVSDTTGSWTTGVTTSALSAGCSVGFSNFGDTNIDFTVKDFGILNKTGTGLADTTVRTAGGYAIRFEPNISTDTLDWIFPVPTGNIQNKTMTLSVWIKINSATYYAGTHQLPRLYVDYDNGTSTYAQALGTTDWQLVSVTITPTTTYGQVVVKLNGKTDATGSNSYFYADDFSVLYPAGYKLDLGNLDNWANGVPVSPPIATVLSANDVWAAATTTDYGANTMGNNLKKLKNPSLLIDGEIIL